MSCGTTSSSAGPQFGCGLAQCGACSVLVDGKEARSCVLPVSRVAGKQITTLEGLPARWASQRGLPAAEAQRTLHPVQQAWIDEQVPMCGFCQNGMMIKATELLEATPVADGRSDQERVHERAVAASLPLRHLLGDPRGRAARGHPHGEGEVAMDHRSRNVHGATLTRRQFVKTGGALVVGFSFVGCRLLGARRRRRPSPGTRSTPRSPRSWFEIHADNTILMRTGKVDFGQSTAHTAYKQIVAEELSVPFEAITTVVMGDTDRTPDGGFSAGYLEYGGANLRKAAAYTYQALLDLAATTLRVDKSQLSVKDGVVSGGGKRISYGELVQGQQLKLTIPVTGDLTSMFGLTVTGNPPMKPVSQYTIIGKSYANTVTPAKVAGKETWVTDVRLPNMLHGRVVHPEDARLHAGVGGHARQGAVPERAGHRQRQPRRRGRADGVGSDHAPRRASRTRHEVDRLEGPARPREGARLAA